MVSGFLVINSTRLPHFTIGFNAGYHQDVGCTEKTGFKHVEHVQSSMMG